MLGKEWKIERDKNGKEKHVVRRRDITEEEKQGRGMKEREREGSIR